MANEDKATRYHRLQRRASVAAMVSAAAVLALSLLTGAALWLRRALEDASGDHWMLTTAAYAAILMLVLEVVELPFSYYQGFTLERQYGLATHTLAHWCRDRAKGMALGLTFGVLAALMVEALLRVMPHYWWIAAAGIIGAFIVLLAHLGPVVLMPIFYEFTPVQRPELVERLLALGRRANATVTGVFEWKLSDRTRKANAALAGLGRTRRILLSDTLLAEHSDDEIEVILAHELAHHVHADIWTAMALDVGCITVGCYAADRVLTMAGRWLGLAGKSDLAGLPLILLTAGAATIVLAPIVHALSRFHERRADRYALDLTGAADAFVTAMKRLASQNLAEEEPSRLTQILFHSHPPTRARIAAAREWAQTPRSKTPRPTS